MIQYIIMLFDPLKIKNSGFKNWSHAELGLVLLRDHIMKKSWKFYHLFL